MMKCHDVTNKLDAYLANRLSAAVQTEIDSHVKACGDCARALRRARGLESLLAEARVPPVPERFGEQVLARVRRGHASDPARIFRAWWRTFSMPMRTAAAVLLLAGAISGAILGWRFSPNTPAGTTEQAGQAESVLAGYGLDALGDTPDGSLAESYLALLNGRNEEGR